MKRNKWMITASLALCLAAQCHATTRAMWAGVGQEATTDITLDVTAASITSMTYTPNATPTGSDMFKGNSDGNRPTVPIGHLSIETSVPVGAIALTDSYSNVSSTDDSASTIVIHSEPGAGITYASSDARVAVGELPGLNNQEEATVFERSDGAQGAAWDWSITAKALADEPQAVTGSYSVTAHAMIVTK